MIPSLFELRLTQAQQEQRPVSLHVQNEVFTGIVVRVTEDVLELRFSGSVILVRLDRINAISTE